MLIFAAPGLTFSQCKCHSNHRTTVFCIFNLPLWLECLLDSMKLGPFLTMPVVPTVWSFSQHIHASCDPVVLFTFSKSSCDTVRWQEAAILDVTLCNVVVSFSILSLRPQLGLIESPSSDSDGDSFVPAAPKCPPLDCFSLMYSWFQFYFSLSLTNLDLHFLVSSYENFSGYWSLGVPETEKLISPIKGKPPG